MHTRHAKSRCCGARIYTLNQRRRPCSSCHRTWTCWPRKRGRKNQRRSQKLLSRVFLRGQDLSDLASHTFHCSPQVLSYRFRQNLVRFANSPSDIPYPPGPLVLLTDGLWFRFQGQRWVLYLAALKPAQGDYAIFLDPWLQRGYECARGWRQILRTIPDPAKQRIRAWITDNVRGLQFLARQHQWILQLCHFHLIIQLQNRRGHWRKALPGHSARSQIYHLIRTLLKTPHEDSIPRLMRQLEILSDRPGVPSRLGMIVREFLRTIDYYRAYRRYPGLGLPITTNSVESMGSLLRDRFRTARHLRTAQSLRLWAIGMIRMRRKITCNGHRFSTD